MKTEIPKRAFFMMTFLTAIVITLLTITLASCGEKAEPAKNSETIAEEHNDAKYTAPKETDAEFLVNATVINLKEIELGQLAQSNYALIEVSNLGKMMEKDHTEVLNELKSLAAKKEVTIPKSLTGTAQEEHEKLKNIVGSDFDKAYCDLMVKGHQDAIEKFTAASLNSTDDEIKSWAESKLPSLKMHLEHSLHCQAKAGILHDPQSKANGTQAK